MKNSDEPSRERRREKAESRKRSVEGVTQVAAPPEDDADGREEHAGEGEVHHEDDVRRGPAFDARHREEAEDDDEQRKREHARPQHLLSANPTFEVRPF